jgi:hypothetical protein
MSGYATHKPGVIATPLELRAASLADYYFRQPGIGARNDWFDEVVPTDPQTYPSCVGRASAQLLMSVIRRQRGRKIIPSHTQLDGDVLWRERRRLHYGGDMDGGLQVHEALEMASDLGWLADSRHKVIHVPVRQDFLDRMLNVMPVLVGLGTSDDWMHANRVNGQIPMNRMPSPWAGHCVMIVDYQKKDGEEYVVIANSWGPEWGRYGYGTLTWGQLEQAAISDFVTLYLPDGIGLEWQRFLTAA